VANVTRTELDADGRSLEELFFAVTEGVDKADVSHPAGAEGEDEA